MCLAFPGRVVSVLGEDPLTRKGKIAFSGVITEVNLCFVPDAGPDDYVLVHAGFAISKIDEPEALRSLNYLDQLEAMARPGNRNDEVR